MILRLEGRIQNATTAIALDSFGMVLGPIWQ
jgi:hypothetical protein